MSPFPYPSRWLPAPRGRQADRPAEDTAVRRALRILWSATGSSGPPRCASSGRCGARPAPARTAGCPVPQARDSDRRRDSPAARLSASRIWFRRPALPDADGAGHARPFSVYRFKCRDQSDLRVHGIAHAARARVLARQLQHQLTEFLADPRAARPTWVSPVASNQTAVPGQQRSRRNPPTAPQCRRQQAGRGCQDRPVGPVRPDPGHLAAQHHHLMPRPGRTSQPNARTMIKYSRRTDTNRDLASTRPPSQIAAHNAYTEF